LLFVTDISILMSKGLPMETVEQVHLEGIGIPLTGYGAVKVYDLKEGDTLIYPAGYQTCAVATSKGHHIGLVKPMLDFKVVQRSPMKRTFSRHSSLSTYFAAI
jgi:hypothetical protein